MEKNINYNQSEHHKGETIGYFCLRKSSMLLKGIISDLIELILIAICFIPVLIYQLFKK